MSSYGHEDGDVPGAEWDGPAASLPDVPLATGMYGWEVRKTRDFTTNATAVPLRCEPFKEKRPLQKIFFKCCGTTFAF